MQQSTAHGVCQTMITLEHYEHDQAMIEDVREDLEKDRSSRFRR